MKVVNWLALVSTVLVSVVASAQIARPEMDKVISDDYLGAPTKTFVTNATVDQLAQEFDVEGGAPLNIKGENCGVQILLAGGNLTFEISVGADQARIEFSKSKAVQEIAVQGLENVSMIYTGIDTLVQIDATNTSAAKLKVKRYEGLVDFAIDSAGRSLVCTTLGR